jgi:hypothetical protein
MNKRIIQIAITLFATILILGIYTLSASTKLSEFDSYSSTISKVFNKDLDMLIFLSPQYAGDEDIRLAIDSYISAVKADIDWNTKLIELDEELNNYTKIDIIIEEYYENYEIKACLIVGEDTDTALGGSSSYMNKPSTVPWQTVGGKDSYVLSDHGVVCKLHKIDIFISLLYPTSSLDFDSKKMHIISSFDKFSNNRKITFEEDLLVFESSDLNTNSKPIYNDIASLGNLVYKQDPTDSEIKKSLDSSYSMFFVHGHSNPSGTDVSSASNGWFSADLVDELNSPLFGADGCYVSGWWTNCPNQDTLTPSITSSWYGSKIFTSRHVRVMALGLLSQNGLSCKVSFIENALPDLSNGSTIAESVIGSFSLGDTIIFGDPTFHFN